jgi:hypothetical protein
VLGWIVRSYRRQKNTGVESPIAPSYVCTIVFFLLFQVLHITITRARSSLCVIPHAKRHKTTNFTFHFGNNFFFPSYDERSIVGIYKKRFFGFVGFLFSLFELLLFSLSIFERCDGCENDDEFMKKC